MAAVARLYRTWRGNTIHFTSKCTPYKSPVTPILLCGFATWALLADCEKKKKRIQAFETKCLWKLLRFSYLEHKTTTGCSRNFWQYNCQETETPMAQACHTPGQPLQNHLSWHLGGCVTAWSAEEILDGKHQKVDIPAHARTAHKGVLQKRLEEDLC